MGSAYLANGNGSISCESMRMARPRRNKGKHPRENPKCPYCGTRYRQVKTGDTFHSVSQSLWVEVESGSRRWKTVHTVLGRWREIKQQHWKQHLRDCEAEESMREPLEEIPF